MTEKPTNLFKTGSRCRICTGCGKCFGKKKMDAVSTFRGGLAEETEDAKNDTMGERASVQESGDVLKTWESGNYLAAVDIGTTTVAMQLRSLQDGSILDTFTCLNPQGKYGADVLSRIEAAGNPQIKEAMCREIREVLQMGITRFGETLARTSSNLDLRDKNAEISGIVIAANTTMVHLLMDLDVSLLGQYPFQPETLSELRTNLFGIPAVILPGISAFVGADIFAGIYALSMHERQEITLLLDLGTNGEMVLGNRERLMATATAAGPAFEGNADCYGTDLMALAARLLDEGLLDETGLLADPYFDEGIDIGGVRLTQNYVRQLQMAKAAICTGICILCEKYGLQTPSQIDKVFLAGGMGYYLSSKAAIRIGLLPAELAGKTVAVGNAALEGAFLYGKRISWSEVGVARGVLQTQSDAGSVSAVGKLPIQVEVFNLAEEPQFSERYIQEMNFPVEG